MNFKVSRNASRDMNQNVRKEKKVRKSVIIVDRIADKIITIGGILVILTVLGIMVYLVKETLPLFQGGEILNSREYALEMTHGEIIASGTDEYNTISYFIFHDGTVQVIHTRTGKTLTSYQLEIGNQKITSAKQSNSRQQLAFGFEDGTVRLAGIEFPYRIITSDQLPVNTTNLGDSDLRNGQTIYSVLPGEQYREIRLKIEMDSPLRVSAQKHPIIAIDYRVSGEAERKTEAFVTVEDDGSVTLNRIKTRINLLTGKKKKVVSKSNLPRIESSELVRSVLMNDRADFVLAVTKSGRAYRFNTSDFSSPFLAEISSLLADDVYLSTMGSLNGDQSIIIGGTDGSLNIYFIINDKQRGTQDGKALVLARSYHEDKSPAAVKIVPSSRGKSFAVAYEDGSIKVIHATSRKTLLEFAKGEAVTGMTVSPRFDGLMMVREDGTVKFTEFSVPHPETTLHTLFQKVWYEGYSEPTYTWQSSAATDDYEQKLSLVPLIFGSIKAAFYSLIFAVPIAILGAIYTSEFVDHRLRNTIKPAMEMMASLPSVVLGFVAALVLAPFVEVWISAVLAAFLVIPAGLVIGSVLWQLLPQYLTIRWQGTPKLALILLILILGVFSTAVVGPWFEKLLFYGNFKGWLNRDVGTGAPFLFLVLTPIVFFICAMFLPRIVRTYFPRIAEDNSKTKIMLFSVTQWVIVVGFSVFSAYQLAHLLSFFGVDARGGFINTYVQRNTLVVGFAMGFAVIPIIYTIAEDALHAVPSHLRAASLGCGATQWQTTIYVILPAAISGVFSAVMIGMGRAVGETMIVVMAAGNTPLIDWNVFNGLRALSATIAVELPEAVKDGTLYRVLFLSGLVLFAMTFVINTVAEIVRLRFRKKTTQL